MAVGEKKLLGGYGDCRRPKMVYEDVMVVGEQKCLEGVTTV